MSRWQVVSEVGLTHVLPIDDLEPHFNMVDCHCHPERHPDSTENIIVHNSFDRRELTEPDRSLGNPN